MASEHHKRHRGCGPAGAWVPDTLNPARRCCGACGVLCACATCRAARPPLLDAPNRCVVLAVDAATRSGWSVWWPYAHGIWRAELHSSGELQPRRITNAIDVVVETVDLAARHALPCVLVLEAAPMASNPVSAFGVGKAVGQWEAAWLAGGGVTSRIVRVQPNEWRRDLWGEAPERDVAREREQREAEAICSNSIRVRVGPDEAPAILIGQWGMCSRQVNAVLQRKYRQPDALADETAAAKAAAKGAA